MPYKVEANKHGFRVSALEDDSPSPVGEYVYVIQLDPHLRPNRVKVGCANDVDVRLRQFRTTHPEATALLVFEVPKSCEQYALMLARHLGKAVGTEVFDFDPSMLAIFLWLLANALHAIQLNGWLLDGSVGTGWERVAEWMEDRNEMDDFMRGHIKKMAADGASGAALRIA